MFKGNWQSGRWSYDDDDGDADEASYDANVGASTDDELLVSC